MILGHPQCDPGKPCICASEHLGYLGEWFWALWRGEAWAWRYLEQAA